MQFGQVPGPGVYNGGGKAKKDAGQTQVGGGGELDQTRGNQYVRLLGGNANIVGGWGKILWETKKWVKIVFGRLNKWPTSQGITKGVIGGLVVNRFLFRVAVNIPMSGQLDIVVGCICRMYRGVSGLSPKTPREALFDTIQEVVPGVRLWACVI